MNRWKRLLGLSEKAVDEAEALRKGAARVEPTIGNAEGAAGNAAQTEKVAAAPTPAPAARTAEEMEIAEREIRLAERRQRLIERQARREGGAQPTSTAAQLAEGAAVKVSKFEKLSPEQLIAKQKVLGFELEAALNVPAQGGSGMIQSALSFLKKGGTPAINSPSPISATQGTRRGVPEILSELAEIRAAPGYASLQVSAKGGKSASNVLGDIIEGKPISDAAFRVLNAKASTGKLNEVSWALRNPGRTLGIALMSSVAGSTLLTRLDVEEPWAMGKMVWSSLYAVTGDKEIPNYSEFLYDMYSTDVIDPKESLKKYFGVDFKKGATWDTAIEALTKNETENQSVIPEVRQALLMYATLQKYGKPAPGIEALAKIEADWKDAQSKIPKAGAAITEQDIAKLRQDARNAPAPDIFGSLPAGAPTTARTAPASSGQPSYNYTITGQIFKQNLDALKQEGTLNDDLYRKLEKAFKDATKAPVSDAEELTAKNVAKSAEIAAFARAAEGIFSQNNAIPRSAISQVVRELVAPAP